MADLAFPMLTISALAPLFGAFAALRPSTPNPRRIATGISLLSALCSFEALREVLASGGVTLLEGWALPVLGASHTLFRADLLSTVTMSLFSAITLATLVIAPRRDCGHASVAGLLFVLAGSLATFAANSLILVVAGWAIGLSHFC